MRGDGSREGGVLTYYHASDVGSRQSPGILTAMHARSAGEHNQPRIGLGNGMANGRSSLANDTWCRVLKLKLASCPPFEETNQSLAPPQVHILADSLKEAVQVLGRDGERDPIRGSAPSDRAQQLCIMNNKVNMGWGGRS